MSESLYEATVNIFCRKVSQTKTKIRKMTISDAKQLQRDTNCNHEKILNE